MLKLKALAAAPWIGPAALATALSFGSMPAQAAVVFSDGFESGLGQWNPSGSAAIVADPFNGSNRVVRFNVLGSGGDAFTGITTPGLFAAGVYTLSVDILGTCTGRNGNCGAFIGIDEGGFPASNERWLIGDATYPANVTVLNNGTWQHVSVTFDSRNYFTGSFGIKMEDFVWSGAPQDVYFDNFRLETVPEPGSIALVGLALAALGVSRRRSARP